MYSITKINDKEGAFGHILHKKLPAIRGVLDLKQLIKYLTTLFVLLLTGYTQVFAHLYGINFSHSSAKPSDAREHFQVPAKRADVPDIYFEEEESTRISLKESSKNHVCSDSHHAYQAGYFLQRLKLPSSLYRYTSLFLLYGTSGPVLHVLRL